MTLETRPITPIFGMEVMLDLGNSRDDAAIAELRSIWLERKVLLLRGQDLADEDILRFARTLGELEIHVRSDFHSARHPEIMMISNKKDDTGKSIGVLGDAEAPWHIDQIYMRTPTFGTMVYCVETPPAGGNTFFCDLASAYDRLPPELLRKIEGRRAINSVEYFNRNNNMTMSAEQLKKTPDVSHPLVRTHPVLGRKSLFFSPGHTARIEGYPEEESREILRQLEHYALQDDLVLEHSWRVGDLVMWDNTTTMHRREPFDGKYTRLMKRVSFMHAPDARTPF